MESMQAQTMGIEDARHQALAPNDLENMFVEQSFNDGLLEMTVVQTLIDLAMDHCRRVGQAEGPFEIKFNEQAELDASCSYIQVDGEFFKCS